jgi:GPH family glycoside/pentoside/hexuronide:cation symporter
VMPIALQLLGIINLTGGRIVPVLSVTMLLVSAGVTTGIVLGGSMMADVADHIELKTGRRMEALMFAAIIMAQKAVSGMGNFVSGLVLTWIAFPEKAVPGQVDVTTITHLGATYLISVGSMIFLALVALSFYPISRKTHEQTAAALRAAGATAAPSA